MKVVAIIQARMGSTRLPGKVLKKICNKPMLHWLLLRLRKSEKINQIVVATTKDEMDLAIVDWIKKEKDIFYYQGHSNDLLDRYFFCSKKYSADVIVRVTADDPLKDPTIIDKAIDIFLSEKDLDYCSNTIQPSYPEGLDIEVFSYSALENSYNNAKLSSEREHLTPYMINNPNKFKLKNFSYKEDLSDWRWTVDKPADFVFMTKLFENFVNDPTIHFEKIIDYVKLNPFLLEINKGTERMEGYKMSVKRESI